MDKTIIYRGNAFGKTPQGRPFVRRTYNILDTGTHLEFELTLGMYALIDYIDFDNLKIYPYRFNGGYAYRGNTNLGEMFAMHQDIANYYDLDITVDHKNRNTLDNRRCNLRLATKIQQMFNQTRSGGGIGSNGSFSSEYRGVHKRHDNGRYRVRVQDKNMVQHNIGHFTNEIKAAEAWDDWMYNEFKEEFPLEGIDHNGIIGEPTINFIQFNFPDRLGLE